MKTAVGIGGFAGGAPRQFQFAFFKQTDESPYAITVYAKVAGCGILPPARTKILREEFAGVGQRNSRRPRFVSPPLFSIPRSFSPSNSMLPISQPRFRCLPNPLWRGSCGGLGHPGANRDEK